MVNIGSIVSMGELIWQFVIRNRAAQNKWFNLHDKEAPMKFKKTLKSGRKNKICSECER